jgi:hypothetical protein
MPYDPELEKAVAICKSDEPQPLKKHEQYEQIRKFANRQRLPTETIEKAVTRFITQDPDGRALYKTFAMSKGASFDAASLPSGRQPGGTGTPKRQSGQDSGDVDGPPAAGETEHMRALRILAATLQAKDPTLSKYQAMAKTIQTVEGARLALADRQARLRVA